MKKILIVLFLMTALSLCAVFAVGCDKTCENHTVGEWIAETPATCTENGVKGHFHCSVCNKDLENDKKTVINDVVIPAGHNFGDWIAEIPATCTENGVKGHFHCSRCDKDFGNDKTTEIDDVMIPATGHDFGDWIAEIPASGTKTGVKGHYHCSRCGKDFANDKKTEITNLIIDKLPPEDINKKSSGTELPGVPA